jgi:hypothetical protein
MGYRCLRIVLLVVGGLLLFTAAFPVFELVPVPDAWATGLVASKLVMLPVGAICLACAAGMRKRVR